MAEDYYEIEKIFFSETYTEDNMSTLDFVLYELKQMEERDMVFTQSYCTMIWTGIELMARFYSGQLLNQQAFKRMKLYLSDFFPIERKKHLSPLISHLLFRLDVNA